MPAMRFITILILPACMLIGCNSKKSEVSSPADSVSTELRVPTPSLSSNEAEEANSGHFQNQVFLIGRAEDFDEDKCAFTSGCDCCTLELHFLSSNRFVYISPCIEEIQYFTGNYSVDSTKMTLVFDSRYITESMEEELEESEGDLGNKHFQIEYCKGKIHLLDKSNMNATHGLRFEADVEKKNRQILFDSKAWKQLSNNSKNDAS